MVGAIERIAQEIAALDSATSAIADEFYSAYLTYLTILGQAVRQQLILASYHVCTQGYPEAFLSLPFSQRQQLQQRLRHLGQQVQEEILAQLHVPVKLDDSEVDPVSLELTSGADSQPDAALLTIAPFASIEEQPSLTPTHLAQWREELEYAIAAELKTASHAANHLLQQANILPQTLPEPVLEAATKAERSEARAGTPNLLNLLVEADSGMVETDPSEESNGRALMHIVAIYLRLAEIEFADPTVAAARSKIRSLFAQLKTLGRGYQAKRHEQSIAEAQAAWRSSWMED
ncbi:MAG: hypothetical protein H7Z11_21590 [Verrucomicrobia bacterium]|nr:hypothetical protein [Leptolyngbya sp. ES-bin-22]